MRTTIAGLASTFLMTACAANVAPPNAKAPSERALFVGERVVLGEGGLALPERQPGVELPVPSASLSRIGFGSCMDQDKPAPAMSALAALAPDLTVLMGDNVYGDADRGDVTLPELRQAYAHLANNADFQTLNATSPIVAVWDDHDYGMNDAGASFTPKPLAEEIFFNFWRVPEDDARRARPGIYFSQIFGEPGRDVHLIVLDTRYFRSDMKRENGRSGPYVQMDDREATILGDAQWSWLEAQLSKPAALTVVVSSIQILAQGHRFESWDRFPLERQRLLDLIDEKVSGDVVFVSGDRHRAGIYQWDRTNGDRVFELTASSFNLPVTMWGGEEEPGPNRVGATYLEENFGLIDIDWDARRLAVSIRDVNGDTVHSATADLNAMVGG